MKRVIYPEWTEIDWDGNLSLGFKCFRKSFGRGHVSIGIGSFRNIVYSHGHDSEESLCSTRWRSDGNHISEQEAMDMVDANKGYHRSQKRR